MVAGSRSPCFHVVHMPDSSDTVEVEGDRVTLSPGSSPAEFASKTYFFIWLELILSFITTCKVESK